MIIHDCVLDEMVLLEGDGSKHQLKCVDGIHSRR